MSELIYSQHSKRTLIKNTGFETTPILFRNRLFKKSALQDGCQSSKLMSSNFPNPKKEAVRSDSFVIAISATKVSMG